MAEVMVSFPKPCRENWGDMTPDGSNRFCGRCTKTIHDLSQYSFDEAQALIRSDAEVCVRARLATDGTIDLRSGAAREAYRIAVSIGASVGLIATSAPAYADKRRPEGAIGGKLDYSWPSIMVTATGADGTRHSATTNRFGRYKIKHLPPGIYQIAFWDGDETRWNGEQVVVEDRKTAIRDTENPNPPIVVGMIEIDRSAG